MRTIAVGELEANISEIVRQLREEGEAIEVTDLGRPVILIMPLNRAERVQMGNIDWADTEALAAEIARYWPEGVSAVDAVRDVRREL